VHAERAHQQKSVSCTSKSVAVVLRSPSGVVDFVMMCDELLIGCVSQNVNQWQRTGFQEATLAPISLQMNISWSEKILLHSIDCSVSSVKRSKKLNTNVVKALHSLLVIAIALLPFLLGQKISIPWARTV
jgi:hypothetical protein